MILTKCVGSNVGDSFNFGLEWRSGTSLSVGALILAGIIVSAHVPHRHETPADSLFSLTDSLFSLGDIFLLTISAVRTCPFLTQSQSRISPVVLQMVVSSNRNT
jgi:hypothetical protein